ncbi:MAG: hypothetical protein WBL39_09355, partial [Terrimicrobiaceae bacterium]
VRAMAKMQSKRAMWKFIPGHASLVCLHIEARQSGARLLNHPKITLAYAAVRFGEGINRM